MISEAEHYIYIEVISFIFRALVWCKIFYFRTNFSSVKSEAAKFIIKWHRRFSIGLFELISKLFTFSLLLDLKLFVFRNNESFRVYVLMPVSIRIFVMYLTFHSNFFSCCLVSKVNSVRLVLPRCKWCSIGHTYRYRKVRLAFFINWKPKVWNLLSHFWQIINEFYFLVGDPSQYITFCSLRTHGELVGRIVSDYLDFW